MNSGEGELLTLPPHLLEAIEALLAADVDLPDDLRRDLRSASESASATPAVPMEDAKEDVVGEVKEDTIPVEVVERLSRWGNSSKGVAALRRGGLDPPRYSLISLLAGTEVYMPPSRRDRLKSAIHPDKPNLYLPAYLSPSPPSLGQEIRRMTSQLTTILNVLFSIGGSGAAVYVAATTGAGWRRESAILLGLLAAVVVGIADGVLIWIYSTRLEEGRKESKQRSLAVNQGPGFGTSTAKSTPDQGTELHPDVQSLNSGDTATSSVKLQDTPALRKRVPRNRPTAD